MPAVTFRMRFAGRRQYPAPVGSPGVTLAAPEIASITPDSPELRALVLGQVGQIFAAMPAVETVTGTATAAAVAAGGSVDVTGTPGSPVVIGTVLTRAVPHTRYRVEHGCTIDGGGAGVVDVYAITPGAAGNAAAGTVLSFEETPAGLDGLATVNAIDPLSGGADPTLLVTFEVETPDAISGIDRAIGGVGWTENVP